MDYNLEGKLAFVTGSTKGIGKATAALLRREGAEVIIHGRTIESVERAKEDLPSAHTVYGDLRDHAQAIVFLASPLSSAINGAVLRADGGVVKSAF